MNAAELAEYIGKKATYSFHIGKGCAEVEMEITDARAIFDRNEVKLVPIAGSGSIWANLNNIKIEEK